jgi:hypothetical protein
MIKYRSDLYKILPDNPITVEVGVAEGLFSHQIVSQWKPSKHFAVDVWNHQPSQRGDGNQPQEWHNANYENVIRLLKPYLDKVVLLRGISWAMARYINNESVDFISIDADHSYEAVKKDIAAYWPKLKKGGVITFHDYLAIEYGVNDAVHQFASANGLEVHLLPENKKEDAGAYIIKP